MRARGAICSAVVVAALASLSIVSSSAAGAIPARRQQSPVSSIDHVSCVSASACAGVGSSSGPPMPPKGYVHIFPMAEWWNGTKWSIKTAHRDRLQYGNFLDVSCSSATFCMAVRGDGFAELWNGRHWSFTSTAPFADGFYAVSCTSTTFCIAVGDAGPSFGGAELTERWNGRRWHMLASPSASGHNALTSISCAEQTCLAVETQLKRGGTVFRLQGGKWLLIGAPWVRKGTWYRLEDISCSAPSRCWAVGSVTTNGTDRERPLIVRYAGGKLTVERSVVGSPRAERGDVNGARGNRPHRDSSTHLSRTGRPDRWTFLYLSAVSCTSRRFCMAIGSGLTKARSDLSIAELWNGKTWKLSRSAPQPRGWGYWLNGVACVGASFCMAVGDRYEQATGPRSETLAEHWDGSRWRVVPSPNPSVPPSH